MLAGTPKFNASAVLADYAKRPNATATAPYVKTVSVLEYQPADRTLLTARLGNNGALVLAPAQKTGSLTVLKELAAGGEASQVTAADRAREFAFRITLTDEAGLPLSGSVATRGEGGAESGLLALDAQGSMQASLMGGQSLTLADLPENTRFAVEELDAEASGFKPSFVVRTDVGGSANASGGAAGDESAHASENANADGGEGTSGGGGADGSASGGGGESAGAAGGNAGGVQRASSSAGSEAHANADAPADDAQRTDGSVASGSIAADTRTEAAFTNTKQAGTLTLSKQVEGQRRRSRTFLRVRGEAHRHRRRPAFGRLFLHAGGKR